MGFLAAIRARLAPPPTAAPVGRGGWGAIVVREPYTGAWQQNVEIRADTALTHYAVYACVGLIASDIGKLALRLVTKDANGIWTETENPAFSPVLRKPNRYQTIHKFIEQWMISKLLHGNAYVLKERDQRGVVVALYVLDPTRVTPLVASDGAVYYQLRRDDLSGLPGDQDLAVPAREIIHDTMVALFHPLIGVSPIFACGLAASQGVSIQANSKSFFQNGSQPGILVTAPAGMSDVQLQRLKDEWENKFSGDNFGKVAFVGGDLKVNPLGMTALDAQLIDQLKWTAENICSCYHVQPYMIGIGPPPPYANVEPLLQQYFSQCIQSLLVNCETCLDEGLGLLDKISGTQYGTEFDIGDLIWMDTATKTKAATDSIAGAAMSPDEARRIYLGLGPTPGGASVYAQQQNYSLAALAARDAADPFAKPAPAPPAVPEDADELDAASFAGRLLHKTLSGLQELYGA